MTQPSPCRDVLLYPAPKLELNFRRISWQTRKKLVRTQFVVVLLSPAANTAALHARAQVRRSSLIVIVVTRSVAGTSNGLRKAFYQAKGASSALLSWADRPSQRVRRSCRRVWRVDPGFPHLPANCRNCAASFGPVPASSCLKNRNVSCQC